MAELTLVASGLQFPEGPIALADGTVLVVEIRSGHLTRVHADGRLERVADCRGGPNGAAMGPDGRIYVCNNGGFEWLELPDGQVAPGNQPDDYIGGRIQVVDLATGTVDDLYTECDGTPLRVAAPLDHPNGCGLPRREPPLRGGDDHRAHLVVGRHRPRAAGRR